MELDRSLFASLPAGRPVPAKIDPVEKEGTRSGPALRPKERLLLVIALVAYANLLLLFLVPLILGHASPSANVRPGELHHAGIAALLVATNVIGALGGALFGAFGPRGGGNERNVMKAAFIGVLALQSFWLVLYVVRYTLRN